MANQIKSSRDAMLEQKQHMADISDLISRIERELALPDSLSPKEDCFLTCKAQLSK